MLLVETERIETGMPGEERGWSFPVLRPGMRPFGLQGGYLFDSPLALCMLMSIFRMRTCIVETLVGLLALVADPQRGVVGIPPVSHGRRRQWREGRVNGERTCSEHETSCNWASTTLRVLYGISGLSSTYDVAIRSGGWSLMETRND